jgi:hypothetical protein
MENKTAELNPRKTHSGRVLAFVLLTLVLTMLSAGIASRAVAGEMNIVPLFSRDSQSQLSVNARQSLTVIDGSFGGATGHFFVDSSGTSFKAPAEVYQGDMFTMKLALGNSSQSPLDAQIQLSFPEGMYLDVRGADGASEVVQTGHDTWAFILAANENNREPDIVVKIRVSNISPGSYNLKCVIEPLEFEGSQS